MTLNIILLLVAITGLANTIAILLLRKTLTEQINVSDGRDGAYRTALMKLEEEGDVREAQIANMALKVAEIEKKLGDLPLEEMQEEYRHLAAFNEGVQNIMGFGPNVPKLDKEGVKRGG